MLTPENAQHELSSSHQALLAARAQLEEEVRARSKAEEQLAQLKQQASPTQSRSRERLESQAAAN